MSIWGLSATIRAPAPDILRFAAYHLERPVIWNKVRTGCTCTSTRPIRSPMRI
ncbi:hypothetical protein N9Y00_06695 [Tateyamaria sp.]|nr:hypothetical protein [Tateyamaria sp.]